MSERNDQSETEIYGSPAQFRTLPDGSMQWMKEFVRGLDGKIVADGKWRPCLSDQEWEQWFANRPPMFQPVTSILSDADRERIAEEVESFKKARKEEEETRKKMDEFRAKLKQNAQQSTRSKKDLLWMDTETTGLGIEHQVIDVAVVRTDYDARKVKGSFKTLVLLEPWADVNPQAMLVHGLDPYNDDFKKTAIPLKEALKGIAELSADAIGAGYNAAFDMNFLKRHYLRTGLPVPDAVDVSKGKFDVYAYTKRAIGNGRIPEGNARLADVTSRLGLRVAEMSHRASHDVANTIALFRYLRDHDLLRREKKTESSQMNLYAHEEE